jgi:hypothetical protein
MFVVSPPRTGRLDLKELGMFPAFGLDCVERSGSVECNLPSKDRFPSQETATLEAVEIIVGTNLDELGHFVAKEELEVRICNCFVAYRELPPPDQRPAFHVVLLQAPPP